MPLAEDSIFRIYSMSKPVTSVAIMMLVEECKIALDDPVSKYIPAWANPGVYAGGFMESFQTRPAARPMLVVDLLRHTSGLTYGFQQNSNVDAAYRKLKLGELATAGTLDEMIEAGHAAARILARRTSNYSVSTDVGLPVGKVSGMPFETFLKAHLRSPGHDRHRVPRAGRGRALLRLLRGRRAGLEGVVGQGPVLQDDPRTSPI